MSDVAQVTRWVEAAKPISLHDGELMRDGWAVRSLRWVDSDFDALLTREVILFVGKQLATVTEDNPVREGWLNLAERCVVRYGKNKRVARDLTRLDLQVLAIRQATAPLHPQNQANLIKWRRNGWDEQLFFDFPDFAEWLLGSPIASQLKITRDAIPLVDGRPGLLVEGVWHSFEALKARFSMEEAPEFKETFVVDRHNHQVYTYLDNGLGLQQHHPYLEMKLVPISTLSEEELERVQNKAHEFIRPDECDLSAEERMEANQDRDFVFQIVSSRIRGTKTNATELIYLRKHPWIRIIVGRDNPELGTKRGQVYEVGFGWRRAIMFPTATTQGRFRALDLWNYRQPEQRVVTSVPITADEASHVFHYVMRYHADGINLGRDIGFNLSHQNCSVFVRFAAKSAGIDVPTEITIPALIARVAPDWMKAVGRAFSKVGRGASYPFKKAGSWMPKKVQVCVGVPAGQASRVGKWAAEKAGAGLLGIGRLLAGGAFGQARRAFVQEGENDRELPAPSRKAFRWLKLSDYRVNLPGILQEWQLEQPSTVVYHRPVKLSIVPPQ